MSVFCARVECLWPLVDTMSLTLAQRFVIIVDAAQYMRVRNLNFSLYKDVGCKDEDYMRSIVRDFCPVCVAHKIYSSFIMFIAQRYSLFIVCVNPAPG